MQMDTGSVFNAYAKNFWQRIGKLTLRKRSLQLRQFDGSVIKTLGYFEGSLELEDKFELIPIIVTVGQKNYGLREKDVLNINFTKLLIEIKMEKKNWKVKKLYSNFKIKRKWYPFL